MSVLNYIEGALEKFGHAAVNLDREIMGEFRSGFERLEADAKKRAAHLFEAIARHPEPIFHGLRMLHPILEVGNVTVVTRYEDVLEVLSRDEDFGVTYAEKMKLITDDENFFLGMGDTPRYTRDATNMMGVVRREEVEDRVAHFVRETAVSIVDNAKAPLDVVARLTRIVPTRLVGSYFGVVAEDENQLADEASTLFAYLFLDLKNDPAVKERALAASKSLNRRIDTAIAARKSNGEDHDDVIGRCLELQAIGIPGMTDLNIRNNLVGLIIGAIPTTSTTASLALDWLLDHPDHLAEAAAAAREDRHEALADLVYEALRFNPMSPGIFRVALKDTTIARGEFHSATIKAGSTVLAATQSAMFDGRKIEHPSKFLPGRSEREYLFWGYGRHTCFGQYINRVQIPGILRALLRKDGLARVEGQAGLLDRSGPFPSHLSLTWNP